MFKQVIKFGSMLLVGSIAARFFALLFRYFAMTRLEIEDYAKLSIYISQYLTLLPLATLSMSTTLSKVLVNQNEQNKKIILFQSGHIVLISAIFAGFVYGLIDAWSTAIDFDWIKTSFVLLSYFCASYISLIVGSALANGDFYKVAVIESSESGLRLILLFVFLFVGLADEKWLLYSFLLGSPFLFFVFFAPKLFETPIYYLSRQKKIDFYYGSILSHSGYLSIISLFTLSYSLWLRYRLIDVSLSDVAFFDLALVLYSIPKLVFASIVRPVVPIAAKKEKKHIVLIHPKKIFVPFLFFVVVMLCIYLLDILRFVFQWIGLVQYISAIPIFLILIIMAPFDFLFGYFSAHLQGAGKIRYVTISVVISICLTLLPALFLINSWGAVGAAISFSFVYIVACVLCAYFSIKTIGLRFGI